MPEHCFKFNLLGGIELRDPEGQLPGRAAQTLRMLLLAVLVHSPRGRATRDRLIGLFWPDHPEAEARRRLSTALYDLRAALGREAIRSEGLAVALRPGFVRTDSVEFETAVREQRWEAAAEIYRGPFLDGVHLAQAEEFDQWAERERRRLADLLGLALEQAVAAAAARADRPAAREWARRIALQRPYDTAAVLAAMRALEASHDRDGALAFAAEYAARIRAQLAIPPDDSVLQYANQLRAASREPDEPARATTGLPQRIVRVATPRLSRYPGFRTVVGMGLMVVALVGWGVAWTEREPRLVPERVAVFPFRISAAEPSGELIQGLPDLLSMNLDGAGELRTIDPATLEASLKLQPLTPAEARALARRFGAGHYVLGSVTGDRLQLRLRATLYATRTGEAEASAEEQGPPGNLIGAADRLSAALAAQRLHGAANRFEREGARTTGSLPALKAWLAGENAFRAGHYDEAVQRFDEATRYDSTFALAHYRYSLAAMWSDRPGTSLERHDSLALRYADRLSPHQHMLLRAYSAWRQGEADQAEYLYRWIVTRWPDDLEAWQQLGETQFHYNPLRGRPIAAAREAFEQVLRLDPGHRGARWHLAMLDALAGTTSGSVRALLALERSDVDALTSLAWRQAVLFRDFSGASRTLDELLRPGQDAYAQFQGRTDLALLLLARGRLRAALLEIEQSPCPSDALDPVRVAAGVASHWWVPAPAADLGRLRDSLQRRVASPNAGGVASDLQLIGLLDLAAGDTLSARTVARRLDTLPAGEAAGVGATQRAGDVLRGLIAARTGRSAEAVALLRPGSRLGWFGFALSHAGPVTSAQRFALAEALSAEGQEDEALGWFQSFGEHSLDDLAYLAPAAVRSAQLLERRHREVEARGYWRRVIELWEGADPEFQPWVTLARQRLDPRQAE